MAPVDTRERLVAAATEVFAEEGYDGARVQDIARRAGLTTGAIYSTFRDKAELLREAIARSSADEVLALPEGDEPFHADEVLALIAQSMIRGASTTDALLLEALVAARRDAVAAETVRTNLADHNRDLAALFVYGKNEGVVDPDLSTQALVTFCQALATGLLVFRCLDVPMPRGSAWSSLVRRLVAALEPTEEEQ